MRPPAFLSPPRLDKDDRPAARRKPEGGPPALTDKHVAMIEAMVHGVVDERVRLITRRVEKVMDGEVVLVDRKLEPGEPLQLHEAAMFLNIRHRNARELSGTPIFQAELAREVQRMRESAKPAAMARLIQLRDRVGQGKAADAKVQLAAAQALLGEAAGPKSTVNVNVSNSVTPGYVIDLTRGDGRKRVIDHGAVGAVIVRDDQGPDAASPDEAAL